MNIRYAHLRRTGLHKPASRTAWESEGAEPLSPTPLTLPHDPARSEVRAIVATSVELTADEALGRAVRIAMWDRGITQRELAPKLGLVQSALSRKLLGNRPWTFAEFLAVAAALGVDARSLLAGVPA